MKTIADFKRRMTKGTKVNSTLYHRDKEGNETLALDLRDRVVTVSQSNSFAMTVPGKFENGKQVSSWCNWPKSSEFSIINENTIQINFSFGRLIYEIIS
jgi:hypothetical protein